MTACVSLELKKLKTDQGTTWKNSGNRDQYEHIEYVSDISTQILWALSDEKYCCCKFEGEANETCQKSINFLKWPTLLLVVGTKLKIYISNPLADDSDYEKRRNKTRNKALKEKNEKEKQTEK